MPTDQCVHDPVEHRPGPAHGHALAILPSGYVDRHALCTYTTDSFGLHNRYEVGVRNTLWSSDGSHEFGG
jgi:hypothetical protein